MSRPVTPFEKLPGAWIDRTLGQVRTCPRCQRRWPWTREFFIVVGTRIDGSAKLSRKCRACRNEMRAIHRRRSTPAHKVIILGPCACQGCREPLTWNGWGWEDVAGRRHSCRAAA